MNIATEVRDKLGVIREAMDEASEHLPEGLYLDAMAALKFVFDKTLVLAARPAEARRLPRKLRLLTLPNDARLTFKSGGFTAVGLWDDATKSIIDQRTNQSFKTPGAWATALNKRCNAWDYVWVGNNTLGELFDEQNYPENLDE